MPFAFRCIDHIQLAAPAGSEELACKFYKDILGLEEIEKPETLKKNGGVWFASCNFQLHIGVEETFSPSKKAHPAFEVDNLEELKIHLSKNQVEYIEDELLPGANRIYIFDPFGNRIEMLEWIKK